MLQFNFSPFPVLETERLLLRQITDDDIHSLFKMRSDARVMKYVDRPLAQTLEDILPLMEKIKTGIAENKDIAWALALKSDQSFVGQIGFWRNEPEHFRGEVGYMLLPEFFGQGLATEALTAVTNYGFDVMKFHSIKGCLDPNNAGSIRVLEKAGYRKEAHFRQDYFFNGKFGDTGVYCMLAGDRGMVEGDE